MAAETPADPTGGTVAGAGPGPHPIRDGLVIAIGVAAASAVAAAHRAEPLLAVGAAAMVAASTPLAVIDLREHRLPNRIVGPLAAAVTVAVVVGGAAGVAGADLGQAAAAIGLGVATAGGLLLLNLVGGLGMGDVKFGYPMATAVGWFGPEALVTTLLVTTIAGGIGALIHLAIHRDRHRHLPYGPFLILGMVAGLLAGA
ncbi:MAG: prepilin peptidase [Actinomycetota bacterium]